MEAAAGDFQQVKRRVGAARLKCYMTQVTHFIATTGLISRFRPLD